MASEDLGVTTPPQASAPVDLAGCAVKPSEGADRTKPAGAICGHCGRYLWDPSDHSADCPASKTVERMTRFCNGAYLVDVYPGNVGALDGLRADVRSLLDAAKSGTAE